MGPSPILSVLHTVTIATMLMVCSHCPTPTLTRTSIQNEFNYNMLNCSYWPTPTPTLLGVGVCVSVGQCDHSITDTGTDQKRHMSTDLKITKGIG